MAIAGRMAAVTAGMSFPDLVRTYVLEPGELHDTFMPPPRSEYPRLAHIVNSLAYGTAGAMYNAPYALDLAHPAFGTVASVRDLLRFGLLFAPRRSAAHPLRRDDPPDDDRSDRRRTRAAGLVEGAPETPRPWGLGFMIRGPHDAGGVSARLACPRHVTAMAARAAVCS